MGKRHHKRRAEQHIQPLDEDDVPSPPWRLRALAVPFAVAVGILVGVTIFGVPENTGFATFLGIAFCVASVVFLHILVVRILPVSRERGKRPLWGGVTSYGSGGYMRFFGQQVDLYGVDDSRPEKRRRGWIWKWWWRPP